MSGIYAFNVSPDISQKVLADRPAVYIAEAENKEQARQIHRSLWNLGYVPFLIVLLPQQIRVYTGFDYSQKDAQKGLLDEFSLDDIRLFLAEFSSGAIDTGRIWQHGRYNNQLDQQQRVDNRLLQNLRQLGKELRNRGLGSLVAHALIGKYVYFRYLWDRGIATIEVEIAHRGRRIFSTENSIEANAHSGDEADLVSTIPTSSGESGANLPISSQETRC